MTEMHEATFSPGQSTQVYAPPIGPLESRRARRERIEAAELAEVARELDSPIEDAEEDFDEFFSDETPAKTKVVFSDEVSIEVTDELAVARERKLTEAADHRPITYQDYDLGS